MSIREYLRVVVEEQNWKAKTSPLLFVVGKMLSGAAATALLQLASEALDLALLPVASAQARALFALAIGLPVALSALFASRLVLLDQDRRAF